MSPDRGRVVGRAVATAWTPEDLLRKQAIEADLIEHGLEGATLEAEARRILAVHQIRPVHEAEAHNALVTAGESLWLDLLIGAGGTVYSNPNSFLGVGDSSTAWAAGQTDLQAATNKLRKAMDLTFPSRSGNVMTWRSTFATTDANFVWNEWAVFNASAAGTMLNRSATNLGTKTNASAWQLTATVTLS